MVKSKTNNLAVTEAARSAAKSLSAFTAVEAQARKIMEAVTTEEPSGNFAEVRFAGAEVTGVIKVGNVVLKIQS